MAASAEALAVSVTHVSDASSTAKDIAGESSARAEHGQQAIDRTAHEMTGMTETVRGTGRTRTANARRPAVRPTVAVNDSVPVCGVRDNSCEDVHETLFPIVKSGRHTPAI